MTAKTSSINGVTRLHEFEIDLEWFERNGSVMCASAEASTLGFKPGQFPDWFDLRGVGMFRMFSLDVNAAEYRDHSGNRFTIFND